VSKHTYHPARGNVLHVNFAPSSGHEFTGPHYGLVISSLAFSKVTGLCIVLPLTTKYHPDQKLHDTHLMVPVPKVAGLKAQGWVYTHQIKTIDYRERGASFVGKIGDDDLDFLIDVMERVRAFVDPDSVG
jgi:mRNA-degrading endonuclease toxin of MazEF toxin-antitoxin module